MNQRTVLLSGLIAHILNIFAVVYEDAVFTAMKLPDE
jgi:hypothetical protein